MVRSRAQFPVALLLACLATSPAAADWLVTRDGARLETKGPWRVEGRRVLFTQPNGTLASLRADEVDLEASAAETKRALEAAVAPPEPPVKPVPVLRLTEKEHPPVALGPDEESGDEKPAEGEGVDTGLEVISWDRSEAQSGDGIEIFGTVRNNGRANVTSPTIVVALYDAEGGLLATADGAVNASAIPAGKTANFRAVFTGIDDFAAARFDAQGKPFALRTEPGAEEAGDVELEEPTGEPLDVELVPEEGESPVAPEPPFG